MPDAKLRVVLVHCGSLMIQTSISMDNNLLISRYDRESRYYQSIYRAGEKLIPYCTALE